MGGGGKSAPPPAAPVYNESMKSVLQSQIELAPQVLEQEIALQPKYQQLQSQMEAQTAKDQLNLYQQLQPEYSRLEDAYTKSTQQNQLVGLQERAPDYIQAFKKAQGTAGIDTAIQNYAQTTLADQMNSGFKLSAEEQRQLEQSSMAGFAARGTALGSQAGMANVLNRYQYAQGRQQNALSQASGIGSYLNQQSGNALTSFYQQPMYAQAFGGQSIQNASMGQQQAGPQYYNPESEVGMGSIYGAYNAKTQYATGMAQANASKKAGAIGMVGSIGAGAIVGGALIF